MAIAGGGGLTPKQQAILDDMSEFLDHMNIVEIPKETDDMNVLSTAKTIRFTGVNVQIVNGLEATNGNSDDPYSLGLAGEAPTATNGLDNLIVGYQEIRESRRSGNDDRRGSHNLVIGAQNNYTSFGGLVAGVFNTVSGPHASVSGAC